MRVHLEYGRSGLDVELPDRHVVKCLGYPPSQPLADPQAAVRQCAGAAQSASPPLAELARGRRNACVVICDVTRPVPNAVLLPPILETLEAAGIPRREILILVATGLHRPNEATNWSRWSAAGGRQLPHREPSRPEPRDQHATWAKARAACRSGSTRATSRPT